ncbi:REP-associated tyrosine transposase [Flavisolibacter tropicus]|uniref:Transposase n=1 Tax=Flavisolibacter tropicus TaxID=1492898 RepID=A0A172TRI7_9BACT|nr:transposase [Flavisolibacter tropicus]ANE49494.1 transposase [Flavisolibacter tropicus]
MSRKYKFRDNDQLYFVSFAVVDWIDLFIRTEYKDILLKSFQYCREHKGLELYAYCIMTSHVHLIIGSQKEPMANIMRDLKRHTSEQLHKAIQQHPGESRKEWMLQLLQQAGSQNSNNRGFQLWRQDNRPIELRDAHRLYQKLNYIHRNPVAAGFVEKEEDWLYSSARNYFGLKGLIEVTLLEPQVVTVT